ncbi:MULTISPECIES: family 43 glycosylhydrolase [unclassified Nocardioides]|uniref:family 43 glycosylhydrolase n=1 Tax=unclassified Nocardioides TaxID=2615069 RepID=UPI003014277E
MTSVAPRRVFPVPLLVALTALALMLAGLVLPATAWAAPTAPAAPTATTDGQSVTVAWAAPGGTPVTGYLVEVRGANDAVVASYQVGADVTSYAFAGLDDGTYTATVTALDADGAAASPASAPVTVDLDLLASWQFAGLGTAAGTTVPDASGNGNAATLRGSGATVSGDALTLPGGASGSSAAYVQMPTGLLNGQDTVTISAWLRNETGSGNYAALFYGAAANPPSRYFLLNPKNPSGLLKTVVTTGTTSTSAPWGTETGISPTTASRGVAGPTTTAGAWGLYTTVIEPTRITGYYNGAKVGSATHATALSSFGTNLVGYIGRSSYADVFYKGGVRDVRVYTKALTDASVAAQYAYDQATADAAALSVPATAAADLALPTAGARGSQVRWTSSNPTLVTSAGAITRPSGADVDVTLTAVVTKGGKQVTREFVVTVLADNAEADVVRVAAAYDVAISEIASDITLRTQVDGVDVAWQSSAPGVLAANGAVTRPATRTPVTLTATFSRDGHTRTRTFDVHVLAADAGRVGSYIATGDTNRTDAIHLALAEGGATTYAPLNNGRPVRYADSYAVKLGSPSIFRRPDGRFGVVATVNSNSSSVYLYDSPDLVTFRNQRLVAFNGLGLNARSVAVAYDNGIAAYRLTFTALGDGKTYQVTSADLATFSAPVEVAAPSAAAAATFPAGAIETSSIGVTPSEYAAVRQAWTRMHATGVQPVDDVAMAAGGSLRLPKGAAVTYSNGGSDTVQPVTWDAASVAAVDTDTPGEYVVTGTVGRTAYPEKLAHQRADPDVTVGDDGRYYLTASYPAIGSDPEGYDRVVLRRADTIAGLADAQEAVLWDEANSALQRYVWAPELTKIDGGWYILFTASRSSNVFDIRPMMLRHTGGDLMDPANWVEVGAMLAKSGDTLAFANFSLDMTYFEQGGRHYVIWAQSAPSSALLMAEIDPENPRQLISNARIIAYPDLAWEGNTATNQQIDEGAAVIKRGDQVYVTYSASTVDDKYSVGLLTADQDADLLDPASWTKTNHPLLTTADLPAGQTGPGHNSFTVDELGNPVIVYHARTTADTTDGGLTDPSRHARARTVHFDATGAPVLNVTAEEELPADRAVSVTVHVEAVPIEVPGVPGMPVVSQRSSTGAVVSWTAPTQDGGADVTGYRVRVTRGGSQVSEQEVTGTSVSLAGLTAGETYQVTVAARNSAGYGAATAPVEVTTLVLPAPLVHYPLKSDLEETVGDRDATAVGTVTYDDGVTLPGGSTSATNYVKLPNGLLPTASPNVSVSVWVKSDTPARNGAAIGFGTPPVNSLPANYWLLNPTGPNGSARSVMTNGVNATQPWTTEVGVSGPATTAKRGSWVNYTTVFTAGTLTSYVDGVRVGSVAKSRTFADYAAAGTLEGYLGRSGYAADAAFKGSFRELSIFDASLSDDQVRELAADDAFILAGARERLSLGDTSAVTGDLTLPTTLADGVTVAWATSDASVVSASGAITVAGAARTATLTATLTRGARTASKEFAVTVPGRDAVVAAAADLLVAPTVVASGDRLPVLDVDGITTTWSTATPGLTVADGVVTATQRTSGTVTAVVSAAGAQSVTKAFTVTVLPAAAARFVLGYTRMPLATQTYGPNLAHGLHLALGAERTGLTALNENQGIVYAQAVPTATVELNDVRTLVDPYVFRTAEGGYGVVATRTLSGGSPDSSAATSMLLFTSPDLRDFTQVGLLEVDPAAGGVRKPRVLWDSAAKRYLISWETPSGTARHATTDDLDEAPTAPANGRPVTDETPATTTATGAVPVNNLVVDAATAEGLRVRFGRIANTGVEVDPVDVAAGGEVDLADVRAQLSYDDGSTATRAITWDPASLAAVDTDTPGDYTVTGTVKQTDYPFPFLVGRADPAVVRWQGKYLFIATTEGAQADLRVRTADTVLGLRTAPESTILTQGGNVPGPLWAPEFHVIQGQLYVFFASGVDQNCWCNVQSHVMRLTGTDPTLAASWGTPQVVQEKDGGRLQLDAEHPGISLDMTYWEDTRGGQTVGYVSWSQRYIAGGVTGDAQLWVATVDPANPARLTSEPRLLTAAEFGWDHNTAAVAEAPYVVRHGDTMYLTYSGSATDNTYVVGLLTAPAGADLTDPAVWTKHVYPVLKSDPSIQQTGPGHSMFSVDEDGNDILVYHAKNNGGSRDAAVRRIHWAADGMPILDMTKDEEVAPANRAVSTTVTVRAAPDTTAPVVTVTVDPAEPGGAAGWHTRPVTVTASATDDVAVAALEQRIGAGAWTSYDGPLSLPEGVTEVSFRASDAAGNTSEPVTRTVRRDGTAPRATAATTPARPNGTAGWFTTRAVRVVVAGTDAGSGVVRREVRVGTGPWRVYSAPVAVPVGTTAVQYRAVDAAGLVSAVGTLAVRLDPTAPSLALKQRKARGKVTVTATARDTGSGVASVRYRVDGGAWKVLRSTVTVKRPGRHTVAVRVTDRAGIVTTKQLKVRVTKR